MKAVIKKDVIALFDGLRFLGAVVCDAPPRIRIGSYGPQLSAEGVVVLFPEEIEMEGAVVEKEEAQ